MCLSQSMTCKDAINSDASLSILCLEFLKNTMNYSMYSMHTIDILFLSSIIV